MSTNILPIDDPAAVAKREDLRADNEQKLLGCLIIAPETIDEISELVAPEDVFDESYRKLYRLIIGMRETHQKITPTTVIVAAKRSGLIEELGGPAEYGRLTNSILNASEYRVYANEVKRLSDIRNGEAAGIEFLRACAQRGCDPRKAVDALVARVQDIGLNADERSRHVADVMREVLAEGDLPENEFNRQRIKTGMPNLDELIGGLYASNLYLLGGRFGSGKSALAADLGARAAADDRSVLLFSVEMTSQEFAQRILSIEAGVNMSAWQRRRTRDEQAAIKNTIDFASSWRWWIDDTSRQSLQSIRASARLRKASDKLDLLIIDNLALIQSSSNDKKVDRYKAITEELKRLSRELDCCILLIAQLNADAENNEPSSTSWADCKSIEGDADVAMMLHKLGEGDDYRLIVTKNRSRGPRGKIALRWDGRYQRFEDATGCNATAPSGQNWNG